MTEAAQPEASIIHPPRPRAPTRPSPPRSSPRPKPNAPSHVVRSAILALLTYALGLIPFYFLTPVHDAVRATLFPLPAAPVAVAPAVATPIAVQPTLSPTTAPRQLQQAVGADTAPFVAPRPTGQATPAPVPTASASDARYAFLLLGYGGDGHDGAYLSDSMMLVVVDPQRKALTLLSVPRDSWVPMLFDGVDPVYEKINAAFAFAKDPSLYPDRLDKYSGSTGAGVFASDTVSRLLGVPIRYYLGLDFVGFRQMIDAVGGVDVDVPAAFSARYPINDNPSINAGWMTVRFASGWQHLNGERAIEYARARETIDNIDEGSDFARSRRQRLIMEAFKTRLFQPGGLVHLPQILAIASQHIDTNYSAPDAAQLSRLILDWKDVTIYQTALTAQNYLEVATGPDGAYILVPSSTDHSWAQIAAFTRRLWQDPATGVAMAGTTVIVENDTGVAGVAGKVSTALEKLGYQVGDPTTGPVQPRSQLVDRTANGAGAVLGKSLQSDLGISFDVSAEPAVNGPSAVVLHLGSADADLAPSVPPSDQPAPFSVAGVEYFGDWPAPQPTPDPRTIRPTARRLPTGTVAPDALSALGTPPASETALLGTASPVATPGTPSPGLTPGTASPVVSPNATPVPPTSPIATGSALTTVPTVAPNASTTPPARLTATPPRQPSASATPSRKPRRSPTAGLGAVATPIP